MYDKLIEEKFNLKNISAGEFELAIKGDYFRGDRIVYFFVTANFGYIVCPNNLYRC